MLREELFERSIERLGFGARGEHLSCPVELSLIDSDMFVPDRRSGCH
jgi:hypothetical protein